MHKVYPSSESLAIDHEPCMTVSSGNARHSWHRCRRALQLFVDSGLGHDAVRGAARLYRRLGDGCPANECRKLDRKVEQRDTCTPKD